MNILGIETSCDETSAAVIKDGTFIITNIVSSQIKIHEKYGGIVPELASRHHLENINIVVEEALKGSGKIDAISVTSGPGLIGSLLIGTTTAQAISNILKIPCVGVNHIEGHIFANYLRTQEDKNTRTAVNPPFIALIVSGGHTDLILAEKLGKYKILGRTRDDAVGEVFDKIAKFLKLGYPGGPVIDRLAKKGNCKNIPLPRPYMRDTWDFSFSGLKTAVINYAREHKNIRTQERLYDLCASFQQACVDVLVEKTVSACKKYKINKIFLGGGVVSNSQLRADMTKKCKSEDIKLFLPVPSLCTDNAAMIASAGYFKIKKSGCGKMTKPSANLELKNW
ncbi:MAG: tRNA (adenosine(37)-N6)-threonylcarbamoyltransferase complex transferase subunit TsaD [Elusimicrobia bacterium]|nr:tRNA (adenosine(37)-N6)-threonylcarbamoyltransferase complex transferase subunit TsaD [Elusimicrobiota bacterium]